MGPAEEEEESAEGEDRKYEVSDEIKEAVAGIALGNGNIDAVHGKDVDEVRIVGDRDGGAAAVNGCELEAGTVFAEADALDLALFDGGEEFAVAPLGTFWKVRRGLGFRGGEEGL